MSDAAFEAQPQPIISLGSELRAGDTLAFHRHRRAQLVYAIRGVITVTTRQAAYVIPPQRAMWMPPGVEHRIDAHQSVAMRSLYIEADKAGAAPSTICVLQVSPLLRELVISMVALGNDYAPESPQARMMQVILDQIATQPVVALSLPMPREPRLLRLAYRLIEDPSDNRDLAQWAQIVGASKRTLNRYFRAETGMSFRDWRQQCRLLRGLEMLVAGNNVTNVALELGYAHSSAFIAMFKRCLGCTPGSYLQQDANNRA